MQKCTEERAVVRTGDPEERVDFVPQRLAQVLLRVDALASENSLRIAFLPKFEIIAFRGFAAYPLVAARWHTRPVENSGRFRMSAIL